MPTQNRKSATRYPGQVASLVPLGILARILASRRRYSLPWLLACLSCLVVFGTLMNPLEAAAVTNKKLFRVGFSTAMFTEVNENDAMAAVKVWTATIAKERGVPTDPAPHVYNNVQEMSLALTVKEVDSLALTSEEYWKLRALLDDEVFIVGSNDENFTEEYLVLVHRDSKIQKIQDLRGRSLAFYNNSRMTLAPIWLDTVLMKAGLPRSLEFCRVAQTSKLTNAVLPVFFRQTDACVVSRNSFKTMCELNPQLNERLRVVFSSPELVPSGFCFRRGYNDSIRKTIITELVQVMSSSSGGQVMTLFQLGKFEAKPLSCLDSAFALLATHERLLSKAKSKP